MFNGKFFQRLLRYHAVPKTYQFLVTVKYQGRRIVQTKMQADGMGSWQAADEIRDRIHDDIEITLTKKKCLGKVKGFDETL